MCFFIPSCPFLTRSGGFFFCLSFVSFSCPFGKSMESRRIHMHAVSQHVPVSWWDLTGLCWWNGKRFRLSHALCWGSVWQRRQWLPDLTRLQNFLGIKITGLCGKKWQPIFVCLQFRKNLLQKQTPYKFKFWREQINLCAAKIWRLTPGICINHVVLIQGLANPVMPFLENKPNLNWSSPPPFIKKSEKKTLIWK